MEVKTPAGGKVQSFFVDGQFEKDDLLVQFDITELEQQKTLKNIIELEANLVSSLQTIRVKRIPYCAKRGKHSA